MEIQNTSSAMVQLWLRLERTEEVLYAQCRRFCPRNILKLWFPATTDNLICDVCRHATLEGYEVLPAVQLHPRKHREFLRAIIAVTCGIGMRKVDLPALDRAFSIAFPHATRINVNKRKQ